MPLERKPVNSSSVASIAYDAEKKEMHVKYHGSGKTYAYSNVPYDVHTRTLLAKSIGQYVSKVIQKNHPARLVR